MISKAELDKLLPRIAAGELNSLDILNLTDRVRKAIQENSALGRELGEYLGKIKQSAKTGDIRTDVNWVPIAQGFLGIGHKPGGKVPFEGLAKEGTTAVLTLLHENEGALTIGSQVKRAGMDWIWFPFSASNPHQGDDLKEVEALFKHAETHLNGGGKIYIHCSAGIHRTGMISYGLLRSLGHSAVQSLELLQKLRPVTSEQAGAARLIWGDQFKRFDSEK